MHEMKPRSRHVLYFLFSPALTVCLLGGTVLQQSTHLKPKDAAPYHARAKAAIDAVPYSISAGAWTGRDEEIPRAAQTLLRPNAIINRTYIENDTSAFPHTRREASLLIVQCLDSNDML